MVAESPSMPPCVLILFVISGSLRFTGNRSTRSSTAFVSTTASFGKSFSGMLTIFKSLCLRRVPAAMSRDAATILNIFSVLGPCVLA